MKKSIEPVDIAQLNVNNCQEPWLHKNLAEAVRIAQKLSSQHDQAIKQLISIYTGIHASVSLVEADSTSAFNNDEYGIFSDSFDACSKLWQTIKPFLQELHQLPSVNTNPLNPLAIVINPDDQKFIDLVETGKLAIGGLVGYLAIARLQDIAHSTSTSRAYQRKAQTIIQYSAADMLNYKNTALHNEFIKLALFAKCNPSKKIAWIGTADAVIATAQARPGTGIYFNPKDEDYSWEANRAWLQATASLGFTFELVEQHFPGFELATVTSQSLLVFTQLVKQIRPEKISTQYSRGYGPTATPQEILLLMELGYCGQKNAKGYLTLEPAKPGRESYSTPSRSNINKLQRSHSWESFFQAAPLPPYKEKTTHFKYCSPK